MVRTVLGGWLVVGALLMAGVAAGLGLGRPFRIDEARDLVGVFAVLGGWATVYLVVAVLAVVDAVRLNRRRDLERLRRAATVAKLVAVPYFVLNFVALVLLAGVVTVFGGRDRAEFGLLGPAAALLFVVLTYLVMLPTSAYGIAGLALMRKHGDVGKPFFVVNLVLHLLFVVDVLSTILVAEVAGQRLGTIRAPGRVARNLLTGVLLVGSVLALAWFVAGGLVLGLRPRTEGLYDVAAVLILASPLELVVLVVVPVVPVVVFRTSVRLCLRGDLDALRRTTGVAKVVAVPLFVQNFLLCSLIVIVLTLLPVAASRGLIIFAGPLAVAIVGAFTSVGLVPTVVGTYLMMLVTSVPGISCLTLMRRRREVSRGFFWIHLVLHLVFVADVVSGLVVAHRARLVWRPVPAGTLQGPEPAVP